MKQTFEAGIYRLDLSNAAFLGDTAWAKESEKGDYVQLSDGMELEISKLYECSSIFHCEARVWCPGKFKVERPFKGIFCLVFYTKKHPAGKLSLSLIRSLRCRNGRLLRRINLSTESEQEQVKGQL